MKPALDPVREENERRDPAHPRRTAALSLVPPCTCAVLDRGRHRKECEAAFRKALGPVLLAAIGGAK